ncbi:hypothetical protein [Aureivirga sp. CE67]|uniref:hypothetical protein n=1 Tax=Aureivirga sp. CE67 TaxID=1788983 RepID=UPI0018CB7AFA|nr:hypothetical protein [Aureivirga sp. CE67]
MTRQEHLKFCERCIHRKLNLKIGLVCDLTDKHADFEKECENFELDTIIAESLDSEEILDFNRRGSRIPTKEYQKLLQEQNFSFGFIASFIVGFFCAILWALISFKTGFTIGFMAIGVGAAVGFANRIFGKGMEPKFGLMGAIIAIFSCTLGKYFSVLVIASRYSGYEFIDGIFLFSPLEIINVIIDDFGLVDLLFYLLAGTEGYKLSFRKFTEKQIFEMTQTK